MFTLTERGKNITWKAWHEFGGCMLPHVTETMIVHHSGKAVIQWDDMTLGQLVEYYPVAGYYLARYAANNFPALGLHQRRELK